MAEFKEELVINALHTDKAEVGKKYWYADNIIELKHCVERNDNTRTLVSIKNHSQCFNFDINPSICTTWSLIYPYEEPPKKRMTNIQLCEWLAKGNGLFKTKLSGYATTKYSYNKNLETEEVPDYFEIRTWDSEEWIEPTVDIYERGCKGGKEMTNEEKAEEYIENLLCKNFDNDGTSLYTEDEIKKAVLYGLAEGRKEEHDKWCSNPFWVMQLENENAKQKAQIEKMKCCGKLKWHDLRKNPNDLPKDSEDDEYYLVAFKNFHNPEETVTGAFHYNGREFVEDDCDKIPYFEKEGVLVGWCELPKFEE